VPDSEISAVPFFATTIEDYHTLTSSESLLGISVRSAERLGSAAFHGTNNPATVADWKTALDATVIAQGTMNLIFHPHGWILPRTARPTH